MSRTINVRQQNVQCDITLPDELPNVYVDDMSQLSLGVPVSRILFHIMDTPPIKEGSEGVVEQRKAVLQLTLPTLALVNLAKQVLAHAASGSDVLRDGFFEQGSLLKQAVADVQSIRDSDNSESEV